jgi:tetratricopeptide (TPR) repeat protein
MDHDPAVALRLAVALAPWWRLRGRLAGQYALLREVTGRAAVGSDGWCAAQIWLGWTAAASADLAGALAHFTAVRDAIGDRGPCRALADCLAGRSVTLANLGRIPEAVQDGRRCLTMARELRYPAGEAHALADLSLAALYPGDLDSAVRLARQAEQITTGIPGWLARTCSITLTMMLTAAGELAAAAGICAAGLASSRDAGDLQNQAALLTLMANLDMQAGRAEDAAARLREALQVNLRAGELFDLVNGLECCGELCAATGAGPRSLRYGPRSTRSCGTSGSRT